MIDDPFHVLSVGLTFDKSRHGEDMKRFSAQTSGRGGRKPNAIRLVSPALPEAVAQKLGTSITATTTTTITSDASSASRAVASALHIPPPPPSLEKFTLRSAQGERDSLRSGSSEASAARSAAPDTSHGDVCGDTDSHKPLPPMSRKRKQHIWARHELKVTGTEGEIPAPLEHFSSLVRPPLSVPAYVVSNLFARSHRIPTPIQMQAIPTLLAKHDLFACAPTGSGKTLAFLVPMFTLLKAPSGPSGTVRALIVSPTMELAEQIEREAFFLMKGERWKFVQHGQSTKGKDIFVTTPGRVANMIKQKLVDLSAVEFLVFDEGDKLWDDSTDFLPVVDEIVGACTNPNKVVALFSATLSERVEANAMSIMTTNPIRIIVQGRTAACKDIEQRLMFCSNELGKVIAMRNLIREGLKPPVLIFVQSIERTKELYDEIRCHGLHVSLMHSRLSAEERDEVVLNFRIGKIWVLITTEVLARGVDFKNIGTVINFDIPLTRESYVHRIGRTGRAGKKGLAITFFTTDDYERLPAIAHLVKEAGYPVEDWMLQLRVGKQRERQLAKHTPHRTIVSTAKRILCGQQRIERQLRAAEAEAEREKATKKENRFRKRGRKEAESDADVEEDDRR